MFKRGLLLQAAAAQAASSSTPQCCYKTLGVDEATTQDRLDKAYLKKAFRKKATILHPDVAETGNDNDYRLLKDAYEEAVRRCTPGYQPNSYRSDQATPSGAGAHYPNRPPQEQWNPTGNGEYPEGHPFARAQAAERAEGERTPGQHGIFSGFFDPTSPWWYVRTALKGLCLYVIYCQYVKCKEFNREVEALYAIHKQAHETGTYAGTPWGRTDGKTTLSPVLPTGDNAEGMTRSEDKKEMSSEEWANMTDKEKELKDLQNPENPHNRLNLWRSHPGMSNGSGTKTDGNTGEQVPFTNGMSYGGYPFTYEGQQARLEHKKQLRLEKKERKEAHERAIEEGLIPKGTPLPKLEKDPVLKPAAAGSIVPLEERKRQQAAALKRAARKHHPVLGDDDEEEEARCAL